MKRGLTDKITLGDIQDDIIFYDGKDSPWDHQLFGRSVARGTVAVFGTDRAPDWDRFVVIDKTEDETYRVIFPRIQLVENKIQFGVDKVTEDDDEYFAVKCTCAPAQQGGYFDCRCGAEQKQCELYAANFHQVDVDYEYEVVTFQHTEKRNLYIYLGPVRKEDCTQDEPLRESYCSCSRKR